MVIVQLKQFAWAARLLLRVDSVSQSTNGRITAFEPRKYFNIYNISINLIRMSFFLNENYDNKTKAMAKKEMNEHTPDLYLNAFFIFT